MKLGIEINIDVTKIDKARIYEGKKGKYLKLTTFVDPDNEDQYGNHGFVTQKKEKDEDIKMPILGNSRVFWQGESGLTQSGQQRADQPHIDDEDIPF